MFARRSLYQTAMFSRLFLLFTIVVVVPTIIVGLISYNIRYEQFQMSAARYLNDIAAMRARQLDTLTKEDMIIADLVTDLVPAQTLILSEMTDQAAADALHKRLTHFTLIHAATIRDMAGNEMSLGFNPTPIAVRSIASPIGPFMGPNGGRIIRALVNGDDQLLTHSTAPILVDGQKVGEMDFYWNSGAVADTLDDGLELYETAEVTVWLGADADGTRRQLWPPNMDPALFGIASTNRQDHPVVLVDSAMANSMTAAQLSKFVDDDGVAHFAGVAKTLNGWVVLAAVEEQEIVGRLATSFFITFSTAISLLFAAIWFLTQSYGSRLLLLGDLLEQAAATVTGPSTDSGARKSRWWQFNNDELTDAIHSVDQLVRNLESRNRQLENKLRQRSFELAKAQGELSEISSSERVMQMTSVLSHEINQPLGNISILVEDWLDEDDIAQIDGLQEDLQAINEMVDQVRAISKTVRDLGSKNAQIETGPVALRPVVEQAYTITVPTLINNDVRFSFDVPDTLPEIVGNKGALLQVFSNLIQNACKAMADNDGGMIVVQAHAGAGNVIVDVTDTGKGIPKDMLADVFRPGVSSRLDAGGSGLGLPIVRRIVESFGGRVAVANSGPDGTTVRLTLSVSKDQT